MICPNCGTEYPPEVTRCPDCDLALVEEHAGGGPQADWIPVFETSDEGQLQVARSMLDAGGIACTVQGEEGHQLISAGTMRLHVRPEDAEAARDLLATPGPEAAAGPAGE